MRNAQLAKTSDRQRSIRQDSTLTLWIGLISVLLLLPVLLESICIGILYINDYLKGNYDISTFAKEHLLTRVFVLNPPAPPGLPSRVHFFGYFDARYSTQILIPDGLLGYRLKPASSVVYLDHSNKYLFITDDNGFIIDLDDPPITLQKSRDTYRIIVLGGSTVMGEGAPRPLQNIVGMLRKAAQERGLMGPKGQRIEFINAGVIHYDSAQEYLYFVSDLLRFKPDLVVVYDGWNDSFSGLQTPFRTEEHQLNDARLAQSYSVRGSADLVAENLRYFLTQSDFKLGMAELLSRIVRCLSDNLYCFSYKPNAVQSPFLSTPFDPLTVEFYRRNHRAFLALADDQLSVALFLQPLVGTDDRTLSSEEKASWWYPRLDELLSENRIPFYEHVRPILADLKGIKGSERHCIADLSHSLKDIPEPVYADSGHLLPKGNEIVAAHMLDQLVLCGLSAVSTRETDWVG
jgi:hypothetical protein